MARSSLSAATAAFALALILGGCPDAPPPGPSPLQGDPITTAAPGTDAVVAPSGLPPFDDAAVLGAARALAQGALDQAKAVQGRLLEAKGKELAARMIAEHGASLERLAAVEKELGLQPTGSLAKDDVEHELAKLMERLENTLEGDIDRVYGETLMTLHKGALQVIGGQLLPAAKDEKLRAALQEMRGQAVRFLGFSKPGH